MTRRFAVCTVAVAAVLGACPAIAAASPPDEGSFRCTFAMDAPTVVDVSGTKMVTATITPGACTGPVNSSSTQICLSTHGQGIDRCAFTTGQGSAQAYFGPYVPGTTYTAKGRGCGGAFRPASTICETVGPLSATL